MGTNTYQSQRHHYITAKLKDAIRVAVFRYTNSTLFQWGKGIFNFALTFTVVTTIFKALTAFGMFGAIILLFVAPIAIIIDVLILVSGVVIGVVLSALALIQFIFILIFLLIKALLTK